MIAEKKNAHAVQYSESITGVQFSPDGAKIVSCGVDKMIKVWGAPPAPDCQPQLPHH